MDIKDNQEPQAPKTLEVLSCTAEFYIATQGRSIAAYKVVNLKTHYNWEYGDDALAAIRKNAQQLGCEVVTDVRQIDCGKYSRQILGTGLILRTETP